MFRKVGQHLQQPSYSGPLTKAGAGKVALKLPPQLLDVLGLRRGQRLKVRTVRGRTILTIRRVASAIFRFVPAKQSGADRVRFEARSRRAGKDLSKRSRLRALGMGR
jgi:antitoxin component of MazEF toxin-antitoxin module